MPSSFCQLHALESISSGPADVGPRPLRWHIRLALKRRIGPRTRHTLKRLLATLIHPEKVAIERAMSQQAAKEGGNGSWRAGDVVQVRSREAIEATLDYAVQLKGCSFMPEMAAYCETTRQIFKPVERFVDERDYRLKKCRGVYLLEGAVCQGTEDFGRCDRSCFFFWRAEWLEKVDR